MLIHIAFNKSKRWLGIVILIVFLGTSAVNGRKVKVNKCCPKDEVIDATLMKCRDSGDKKWSPIYFPDLANQFGDTEAAKDVDGHEVVSKIPDCPETGVHIFPLRDLEDQSIYAVKFRLLKSGKIVAKHVNGNWITVPNGACIDGMQNFENSGSLYSGEETDQVLLVCPLLEEEEEL